MALVLEVVAKRRNPTTGFGRRLKELREAAGLTQTELGERAGMVYQAVAKLERGSVEPTWPTVLRLADALGVPTDKFREPTPTLDRPKRKGN